MLANLRKPQVDLASLILRLGLAIIIGYHGILKVNQGNGTKWSEKLEETPQMVVAWAEVAGGAALAVGFLSRLAALGIIIIQAGAIALVTGSEMVNIRFNIEGFDFKRPGYEYNFVIIVMCLAVMLVGSGKFAVDHLLWGGKKE
jgi:putative oxidoreductase